LLLPYSLLSVKVLWRIGTISMLAAVTIWTYVLYYLAEQRLARLGQQITGADARTNQAGSMHAQVCLSDQYWRDLRNLLAELAEVAGANILAEPTIPPTSPAELGLCFLEAERMMREWLEHLIPPDSRYVVYYIFGGFLYPSPEVQRGWDRRPPDLQRDAFRRDELLKLTKINKWVVVPNINQPDPGDEEYFPLCFDASIQSFAFLPLMVEEPASRSATQRNGLAVGTLIIDSKAVDQISVEFCTRAVLATCDVLALAFASARSRFSKEG
jgi:hypothetical protein